MSCKDLRQLASGIVFLTIFCCQAHGFQAFFQCTTEAEANLPVSELVLAENQYYSGVPKQTNNDFTLPIGFFRLVPVNENFQNDLADEDVLNAINNTLTESEVKYDLSGCGFSFAHFEAIDVQGSTHEQISTNINILMSSIYNTFHNEMIVMFLLPDTYYINGNQYNCGGYVGGVKLLWSEHCLSEFSSDILSHEAGHMMSLSHTFSGGGGSQTNVFSVLGPDNEIHDYLSNCPGELVDGSNCLVKADLLCDTRPEANSCCTQIKDLNAEYYVYSEQYGWLEGGSYYVPNYEHPVFTEHPWWSQQAFFDMYLDPIDPCLSVTTLWDCNADEMSNPFETDGFYNVMTYPGAECPTAFTPDQMEKVVAYLNNSTHIPQVQDIITDLFITEDGDEDQDESTYSTIYSAFDFISSDHFQQYRVFVMPDYEGVETQHVKLNSNGHRDILPGYDGKPIFVNLIGVSSITGSGDDLVWVPALQGDILVHQDETACKAPISVYGRVDLTIENLAFENFGYARQFGPLFESGTVIDFRGSSLELHNCGFNENGLLTTRSSTADECSGVVYFAPRQEPHLVVSNCLFTNNQSPSGPAVAIGMGDVEGAGAGFATFEQTTFADNHYTAGATERGALHVQALGSSILRNCIFSGSDPNHGTPGNQMPLEVEFSVPTELLATIENCLFDQEDWIDQHLSQLDPSNIVIDHTETPGYVSAQNLDYRLRWDSICMDKGSSSVSMDFDLTPSDIGWKPNYQETEISGTLTLTEPGNYQVVGTTTISGTDTVIPDGTTIRADAAYSILIRDTNASGGYHITAGDPNGARTAFVGSSSGGGFVFGSTSTAPNLATLSLDGVLFNRGATFSLGFLWFNYCTVNIDGANGNVKFGDYDHTEVVFDEICQGEFKNYDFTAVHIANTTSGIGCIDVQYSDVDLHNIVFDRVNFGQDPWYWKVLHYGTIPGNPTHVIANCSFDAQDNDYFIVPMILDGATINMHHNQFYQIEAGAISMGSTTLNMKNGAANEFSKPINSTYDQYPIIDGYQSASNLACGYNSFIDGEINAGNMFIISGCASTDWTNNFWGLACDDEVSPAGHIPQCADYTPQLAECPEQIIPCEDQDEESELYALGVSSNTLLNYEAAVAYWYQLMIDYPDSKYCTEVTSSIKSIGLFTEYGAESYEDVRGFLEQAAAESEPVDELLSVYQVCSAWCVEARHGDRVGAVALLDSLSEEKRGNEKALELIDTALAEIALYPTQGQGNSLDLDAQVAELVRRQDRQLAFHRALVPAMTKSPLVGTIEPSMLVPTRFGITSCHPNPFNPAVTIELESIGDEFLRLGVYNITGQLVHVLHEGTITSGTHKFNWTAEAQSSGLYLVRAQQGNQASVAKVMLVR